MRPVYVISLPEPEARSWAVVIDAALGKLWPASPVDSQTPEGPWQYRQRNVKAPTHQDSKLAACQPVFNLLQSGCSVPSNEGSLPDVILLVTRR